MAVQVLFREMLLPGLVIIAHSILLQSPSNVFFKHFVRVHVVPPYSRTDTTVARKKLCFILSDRFDFHMINNISITVHVFTSHILMTFSVDEMLLPR